ncbi:MAG: hypothetical protein E7185_02235 [Erysipelotrichaceae bacterium]|nr:hypothetical protein [Erysipelotrichaceae bacterium]
MNNTTTKKHTVRNVLLIAVACGLLFLTVRKAGMQSDREKYMGHGFEYMNGYSSTDFSGYHVFDGDKLNLLDHPVSFHIEKEEDMPVLDGAEACYPLYNAIALSVYDNIAEIEKDIWAKAEDEMDGRKAEPDQELMDVFYCNGKYVSFTNTVRAYERLIRGDVDIVFGARPSANQRRNATYMYEQIETLPIGREAFVFFVEEDNPVESLSSEQVRAIYHGDITNWQEVGGKNQEIIAFQRPEDSGSQVMMKYFMGDVSLKEPKTFEYDSAMGGVVKQVAQYHNEKGALGYTFRYFLNSLQQETHVKMLKIDGIEPSVENIRNGTYPIIADVVAAKLVSNQKENVAGLLDFLLSDDGQKLIENNGYAPLADRNAGSRIENELPDSYEVYRGSDENGEWEMQVFPQPEDYWERLFILKRDDQSVKGQIGTYINEDGSESSELFDQHFLFEINAVIDDEKIVIQDLIFNKSDILLPSEGTVLTKEEQ